MGVIAPGGYSQFNYTAQNDKDKPQQTEPRLGAGFGRQDQFTGTDDGSGNDQPRAQPT